MIPGLALYLPYIACYPTFHLHLAFYAPANADMPYRQIGYVSGHSQRAFSAPKIGLTRANPYHRECAEPGFRDQRQHVSIVAYSLARVIARISGGLLDFAIDIENGTEPGNRGGACHVSPLWVTGQRHPCPPYACAIVAAVAPTTMPARSPLSIPRVCRPLKRPDAVSVGRSPFRHYFATISPLDSSPPFTALARFRHAACWTGPHDTGSCAYNVKRAGSGAGPSGKGGRHAGKPHLNGQHR